MDLEAHLQDQGVPADVVSCLAHLQVSQNEVHSAAGLSKDVKESCPPVLLFVLRLIFQLNFAGRLHQ